MSVLPPIKRITKEDMKDAPPWIDRLLYPLNLFLDSVYGALNKGLTFSENIVSQTASFPIVAGASATANTTKFTLTMKRKPEGLILLSATQPGGNFTPIGTPIYVEWYYDGVYVNITAISGLTNGKSYDFKVLMV